MKVLVLFYSTYGHVYRLAQAIADGAREVAGAEVVLKRVPETLPPDVLTAMGATDAQKAFASVPMATVEDLAAADATGGLWAQGKLIGKVGSVFTSSATQHGGQESTILSFHTTLLHHGMLIVGLPYAFQGQMRLDEITGGSPYGASTIAGGKGERMASENELAAARFQGRHVAQIAQRLFR